MELLTKIQAVYEEYQPPTESGLSQPLESIESITTLRRRIESFDLYKQYLDSGDRFLEWGCRHGIISYMIYDYLSPREVEIHGCDVRAGGSIDVFSSKAGMVYSPIEHPYQLKYEDNFFDVVISNGVLEHVPNDAESLKELHRIMRNNGYLIITFLPNKRSYTEYIGQNFIGGGHRRKYSLNEIRSMLLHTGFQPLSWGYHQFMPSLSYFRGNVKKTQQLSGVVDRLYSLNRFAEKIWPLYLFSANLYVIAQRRMML